MATITEPQIDLFGTQTITLDNVQQAADFVNSSERNKMAFAEKIGQQIAQGSKNYLALGAALAIIGKYAKAAEMLGKAGDSKEKYLELAYCLRKIGEYPEVVEKATAELMPHHICIYLYELAQEFNRFYENNRVIGDPREGLRLKLVESYAQTLKDGLALLNISAPEKM